MANITVPNKNTGDQHTAAELNQQVGWANSPMKDLGAFNPAMVFDSQGYYDKYTLTSDIVISATGIVDGQFRSLWVETDGIHTITAGAGMSVSITDFTNVVAAGTYLFMFGSFPDETGVSKVVTSVPNITFAEGTLTTPTLTATAGDTDVTLIVSNEDVRQTGRVLLRNTVNDFGTATPVAGYDNTTNYVDDNDGAGLVTGTEYFYFFYNTATGLNDSGVATDSATPATSIILMQDAFDDSSIDISKWGEITDVNGATTETTVLTLSATGETSARFGLYTLNGYSSANDLLIAQVTMDHGPDANIIPRFTMTAAQGDDDQNRGLIISRSADPPLNEARLIVSDAGVTEINENTGQVFPLTVRIKYVPSTGAIDFEYWNSSAWASLGSTGNVDLGPTVYANCLSNAGPTVTSEVNIFSNFFISDDDYSTQFPV